MWCLSVYMTLEKMGGGGGGGGGGRTSTLHCIVRMFKILLEFSI